MSAPFSVARKVTCCRLGHEEIIQASSNSLPPPTHSPRWCRGLVRSKVHGWCTMLQRHHNSIHILQASLMANHLITKMQQVKATWPTILMKTQSPSMCGNTLLVEVFQHWLGQGSTKEWLPNPDFETPYGHSTVYGTNKPMEPSAIVTINNKYVAAPPSQTNNWGWGKLACAGGGGGHGCRPKEGLGLGNGPP